MVMAYLPFLHLKLVPSGSFMESTTYGYGIFFPDPGLTGPDAAGSIMGQGIAQSSKFGRPEHPP